MADPPVPTEAPREPWVSPVHTTSADEKAAWAAISAEAGRAYDAGVAAGRTQIMDALEPADKYKTQTLTDEGLAEVHEMHKVVHPAAAESGVFEPERNPSGCDKFWCIDVLPELAYAYGRILAAGRTQAAAYLERRAWEIRASARSVADQGLAAALHNVANELRAENT